MSDRQAEERQEPQKVHRHRLDHTPSKLPAFRFADFKLRKGSSAGASSAAAAAGQGVRSPLSPRTTTTKNFASAAPSSSTASAFVHIATPVITPPSSAIDNAPNDAPKPLEAQELPANSASPRPPDHRQPFHLKSPPRRKPSRNNDGIADQSASHLSSAARKSAPQQSRPQSPSSEWAGGQLLRQTSNHPSSPPPPKIFSAQHSPADTALSPEQFSATRTPRTSNASNGSAKKTLIPPIRSFKSPTVRQSVDMSSSRMSSRAGSATWAARPSSGCDDYDDEEYDPMDTTIRAPLDDVTLRALEGDPVDAPRRASLRLSSRLDYRDKHTTSARDAEPASSWNLQREERLARDQEMAAARERRRERLSMSRESEDEDVTVRPRPRLRLPTRERQSHPPPVSYTPSSLSSPLQRRASASSNNEDSGESSISTIRRTTTLPIDDDTASRRKLIRASVGSRGYAQEQTQSSPIYIGHKSSTNELQSRAVSLRNRARMSSIGESSTPTSATRPPSYRQSLLPPATPRTYYSSPLTERTFSGAAPAAPSTIEGNKSGRTTREGSAIWDHPDKVLSSLERLGISSRLPSTSNAAISDATKSNAVTNTTDGRPTTASTNATTMSISPRVRGRLGSNAGLDSNGASPMTRGAEKYTDLLQAAMEKAQSLENKQVRISSQTIEALESIKSDAMVFASITGGSRQSRDLSSLQSTVGSTVGPSAGGMSERQLRKKGESLCRSITELMLALSAGRAPSPPPAPPVSAPLPTSTQLPQSRLMRPSRVESMPSRASEVPSRLEKPNRIESMPSRASEIPSRLEKPNTFRFEAPSRSSNVNGPIKREPPSKLEGPRISSIGAIGAGDGRRPSLLRRPRAAGTSAADEQPASPAARTTNIRSSLPMRRHYGAAANGDQ